MHNRITSALVRECRTDRMLEIQPSTQINFLQGRDAEGFLLALAGLFGGLPDNCFCEREEYEVKAAVVWTDGLSCTLGARFSKEEKAVWVHSVDDTKSGLSAHSAERVKAIHKRRFRNGSNTTHIFDNRSKSGSFDTLGESDETLRRFQLFLKETQRRSLLGDTRPLFLYNFLERLDEAVDLQPIFEALKATERQIFIAVLHSYQIKISEEMPHDTAVHTL